MASAAPATSSSRREESINPNFYHHHHHSFTGGSSSSCSSWVNRSFLKDGKLRPAERYWRFYSADNSNSNSNSNNQKNHLFSPTAVDIIIVPDALTWRKYLRVIKSMIQEIQITKVQESQSMKDDDEDGNKTSIGVKFILLESTAELMDYRNQSPCIIQENHDNHIVTREMAAPQERTILQKLIQDSSLVVVVNNNNNNNNKHVVSVGTFCDFSVRDPDVDEWDMMGYSHMSIMERCCHQNALVRAARMISETMNKSNQQQVWLVVAVAGDDDEVNAECHLDEALEDIVKYSSMEAIIRFLANQYFNNDCDRIVERWMDIKQTCDENYLSRNYPMFSINESNQQQLLQKGVFSEEEIRKAIRDGKLFRGRLNVSKENPKEAFVSVGGKANVLYFVDQQKGHFNSAFHQDIVIIQPLPEDQWGRPVGRRRLVFHTQDDDDEKNEHDSTSLPTMPSAFVVAIHQPGRRILVATMTDVPLNDESAVLVIPMDIRFPKIRIRTRAWRRFIGVRLKVEVDGWEEGSNYPNGHCIDILGPIGDLETEITALLIENQVNLDPFSTEALACLPLEGDSWKVSETDIRDRRDLRKSRRIFSVDPPGCQDIDDSMHAEILPNGDIEVGVHIADVTHFVAHNSSLDKEAQIRGTTFYLVDRRFDMLPALLSSNLCSLHGGTDRLAVSVIWTLSPDFQEIKSCWYGRTVIHNCAAMTYDQADNILQNKPPEGPNQAPPPPLTAGSPVDPKLIKHLKRDLTILTELARLKRGEREVFGGAVDLSGNDTGNELKFTLESGKPTKVVGKEDKEIHHTIAELMIMANASVAKRIHDYFPESSLLRIHRRIEENRLEDLREVLKTIGLSLNGIDNKDLAKALKEVQKSNKPTTVKALFQSLATRAMTEAQYICTGTREEGTDLSHYGLGLQHYTHFTSPIRRYADVVVHKQLLASLMIGSTQVDPHRFGAKVKENKPLSKLPSSKVVSIFAGEGLGHKDGNLVDSFMHGAAEEVLESGVPDLVDESNVDNKIKDDFKGDITPYHSSEVSVICDGLNLHNRLAKQSSFECQGLFLSLYFKENSEETTGVVTQLRENGFWVYVPKFDFRGPVFVCDTNNDVQIDPALCGLSADSGLAATLGFAASSRCRRFPLGKSELFSDPDERLEVTLPQKESKAFVVRPLDVVTVELTCDNWDVRARVPIPRLQLLSKSRNFKSSKEESISKEKIDITSSSLQKRDQPLEKKTADNCNKMLSLFDVLTNIPVRPFLDAPLRCQIPKPAKPRDTQRSESLPGRFIFRDFVNPDTRMFAQKAAQDAAAADAAIRRAHVVETAARRNEFDTSRTIEKNITMRQQRIAAEKRNTRKSKGK